MRDKFDSIGHLLSKYRYVKLSLESMKTLLPEKNRLNNKFDPYAIQSKKEEAFCFVGDVESFVHEYYKRQGGTFRVPLDCLNLIFLLRFCSDASKFKSYGHLALHFSKRIKKGEQLPKRLKYKPHLHDIATDMNKQIEQYFIDKGYIGQEKALQKM